MSNVSRRHFLKSAVAIGGVSILPSRLWAKSPNSKLTYALAGCGGNGTANMTTMVNHPNLEVVAICDFDKNQMVKAQDRLSKDHPQMKFSFEMYQDYREMLSKLGDKLDCIFVSTPDHNHHPVTLEAMKQGKHVYTQKPLTNKIRHARELREVANKTGVVNRMGIQLHSEIGNRTVVQLRRYADRDRSAGRYRQQIPRPEAGVGREGDEVPQHAGSRQTGLRLQMLD